MSKTEEGILFKSLLTKIRQEFRRLDLVIKTKRMQELEVNEFYVNAYYDHEADRDGECPIEVIIYHNIDVQEVFEHVQIGQFLIQLYDAVVHELRHQQQSRSRKHKDNPYNVDESCTVSYLSDPDEIDAYAQSISIELVRALGRDRSIKYLHRASHLAKIRPKGLYASPNLLAYFQTFKEIEHPVMQKLIKKVYRNLISLDTDVIFY